MIDFDPEIVDEIRIEAGDTHALLRKEDAQWRLPDHYGFSGDGGEVQRLLDRLAGLEKG